ncbi:MAG: TIGR01212 family radical SAM protein [Candidatus Desulfofervidaceae bacterium]|nr:TIGR01212 family radical SAM protein [Candidatus Desulfofervidaceae bacterium]
MKAERIHNKQHKRYYDFNTFLRQSFGCRVHKISLDAGLSCPNRDGSKGKGGCIYCNPYGSGTGAYAKGISISEQIVQAKTFLARRYKAEKFIAYFQSFCNTYGPYEKLKALYEEALAHEDIVGLAVGTRPDCVDEKIIDLLASYTNKYQVWIEYGLQSIHNRTLDFINRGHTYEDFLQAIKLTSGRGILICVHIILGLPGETKADMLATVRALGQLPVDGIKFHHLYVVKGTRLASLYEKGEYTPLSQEEYIDILVEALELLPSRVVIQRLMGDPRPEELIAPDWSLRKRETLNLINQVLEERNTWQGRRFSS